MQLLAFDTATEHLALAVHAHGRSVARVVPGGAAASASLLPLARSLLAEAGIDLHTLQAIAFGRGPGAFTGLRTSCAVAQGLALGLGCPVLAVDSLLIVAEDARVQLQQAADGQGDGGGLDVQIDVGVAMDARMGEVYAARWRWQAEAGRWLGVEAARLCSPETLARQWAGASAPAVVAGSALAAFPLVWQWPPGTRLLQREHDRAAALLRLALTAWAAGEGQDAGEAVPLYVRDKVAQTTEERAALRAAQATVGAPSPAQAPLPQPGVPLPTGPRA